MGPPRQIRVVREILIEDALQAMILEHHKCGRPDDEQQADDRAGGRSGSSRKRA